MKSVVFELCLLTVFLSLSLSLQYVERTKSGWKECSHSNESIQLFVFFEKSTEWVHLPDECLFNGYSKMTWSRNFVKHFSHVNKSITSFMGCSEEKKKSPFETWNSLDALLGLAFAFVYPVEMWYFHKQIAIELIEYLFDLAFSP